MSVIKSIKKRNPRLYNYFQSIVSFKGTRPLESYSKEDLQRLLAEYMKKDFEQFKNS